MAKEFEVITQSEGRPYLQIGGPRPNTRMLYYGGDTNYVQIGGVGNPQLGGIAPIRVHAPGSVGQFARVGSVISPADDATATLTMMEKRGSIPRHLLGINCLLNVYLNHGRCKSLDDFDFGWEDYVEIYSRGKITDRSPGDRFTFEGSDPLQTDLTVVWEGGIYPVGSMMFGEVLAMAVTLELQDVTFDSHVVCGDCGPADDGTNGWYTVEAGAVAGKPIVHYHVSLNGVVTTGTSSIAAAVNAEVPCAIARMGPYLIVLSPTATGATQGGYYYAVINPITRIPGTWVKVTAGFTNTFEPRDMVVLGPREAYICCDSGEILKLTDVPAGAVSLGIQTSEDLHRIAASGDCIVSVGTNAVVVRSINRGLTWGVTTTLPGAATLTAVDVRDRNRIMVGDAAGVVRYTLNGGESAWVVLTHTTGTPATIQDIVFATDEVGYIAWATAGPLARLSATIDGGSSWIDTTVTQPRLYGLPVLVTQRFNRIAVPDTSNPGINANNVALVGLGAVADGTSWLGAGNIF